MAKRLVRGKGGLRMVSIDGEGSMFDLPEPIWQEDALVMERNCAVQPQSVICVYIHCSILHAAILTVELGLTFFIDG